VKTYKQTNKQTNRNIFLTVMRTLNCLSMLHYFPIRFALKIVLFILFLTLLRGFVLARTNLRDVKGVSMKILKSGSFS